MSEDPLEKLKRQIEEERTGRRYVSPNPRAYFELDRITVPRGENLVGFVVIEAGRKDLWVDRLDLFVDGVARSAGSLHTSTSFQIARNASVSAGEVRQFPVWVAVPRDTSLGSKMLMLKGAPADATDYFVVEPEAYFTELAHGFADATQMALQAWEAAPSSDGVLARLRPARSKRQAHGKVSLEMSLREGELVGALIIERLSSTVIGSLRALVRPSSRRIPFSLPLDEKFAAEKLLALFEAHVNRDAHLPIPVTGKSAVASDHNLPISSAESPP